MPFETNCAATVPARAALAGNPSDGYGGRVVATVIPQMEATVSIQPASEFRVGEESFDTTDHLPPFDAVGDAALFLASIEVAARRWPVAPCTIEWTTSIPRSIGLSGSSALVIATLKALADANQQVIEPAQLPQMALAAEKLLGITAGLQDRVVQTYGGMQDMTFPSRAGSSAKPSRPGLSGKNSPGFTQQTLAPRRQLDLAVLYDTSAAEPSQVFHGELRQRYDDGDQSVRRAMRELALAAETAASSIATGDLKQLGVAMNESFDLRASMSDLSPSHVRLIDMARSCGLPANYAGSGGAAVVLVSSNQGGERLATLADQEHLELHRWTVETRSPQ